MDSGGVHVCYVKVCDMCSGWSCMVCVGVWIKVASCSLPLSLLQTMPVL